MYAIVPAYNESATVGRVVSVLADAGVFKDVVVVDDGSSDDTAQVAAAAGAAVLRPARNLGKGGAMLFGYAAMRDLSERDDDDRVAFFDADLIGMRPEHVRRMADASALGYDQVAGLCDRGELVNVMQVFSDLLTGQRIVRSWVLDALPLSCWKGYCIETAINDVVERRGGKTVLIVLEGVGCRTKLAKTGTLTGLRNHHEMFRQIARTKRALQDSEGLSCALEF